MASFIQSIDFFNWNLVGVGYVHPTKFIDYFIAIPNNKWAQYKHELAQLIQNS